MKKFKFHSTRDMHPDRFNLKFGSTKHSYSMGFVDRCLGKRNNRRTIKNRYGIKSANAYNLGYYAAKK